MNKNLWRIIFNRSRGMLMVVAEIAGSGQGGGGASGLGATLMRITGKLRPLSVALWLSIGAIVPVQAAIQADKSAPGNQQPTIISSANGTPQVNIQTPSAGGVSRNVYSQFDVDKKGVILNNSHKNVQTETGGMVAANPWLARGSASVILNEVNARDPSKLGGYIEVAGQKAQVVIANPAGITCEGCGFINASRATLTTGQTQLNNGVITGYDVSRGEIVVQGAGLDSSRQDYTDIIARSVKVNAGVWANSLAVTTGTNRVDAAHNTVQAKNTADAKPAFALDVAAVGGMYAGKIRLTGTEKGVGVHNAGQIGASAGSVTINADGTIGNTGSITASESLTLATQGSISNSGTLYAHNTTATAAGALSNRGVIAAAKNTVLNAASVSSTDASALAAGISSDGKLTGSGNLTVNARSGVQANGQLLAAESVAISGSVLELSHAQSYATEAINLRATSGDVTLSQGKTQAGRVTINAAGSLHNDNASLQAQALTVNSSAISNRQGTLQAEKLTLNATSLDNQQGTLYHTGSDDLMLSMAQGINNAGGLIASHANNLSVVTPRLNNENGAVQHLGNGVFRTETGMLLGSNGTLTSSGTFSLSGGKLGLDNARISAGHITLAGESLSNRGGKLVQTGRDALSVSVSGVLDNTEGYMASQGGVALSAGSVDNTLGNITAVEGPLSITSQGALLNRNGTLQAGGPVTLTASLLDNLRGNVSGASDVTLKTTGAISNINGLLGAGKTLKLLSASVDNSNGQIAGEAVAVDTGTGAFNNSNGQLLSNGALTLNSGELKNKGGVVQAASALTLDTHGQQLDNSASTIYSGGAMVLRTGALTNTTGSITTASTLTLNSAAVNNTGGTLASVGAASLTTGAFNNSNGARVRADSLTLNTNGQLLNNSNSGAEGGLIASISLEVSSGELNNTNGYVQGQNVGLTSNGRAFSNAGGEVIAASALDIDTRGGNLNNALGSLLSGGTLRLASGTLDNSTGLIQSTAALSLDTAALINRNTLETGGILSASTLTLSSAELDNQSGLIVANNDLVINTGNLDNRSGSIGSQQGALSLESQRVDNSAGLIQAADRVAINTHGQALLNRNSGERGGIFSGDELRLQTGALDNAAGVISGASLNLLSQTLDNRNGLLLSSGDMAIDTQGAELNNSETGSAGIRAQGALTLNTGELNNAGGFIAARDATLNTASLNNQSGTLSGNDRLAITATSVNNHLGVLQSAGDITLASNGLDNTQGRVLADGTLGIATRNISNQQGLLQGGSGITLVQTGKLDNQGGNVLSGGNLSLGTTQLDNRGGEVFAAGDATFNVQGITDNRDGFIKANDTLSLSTASLNNSGTGSGAKGVEANDIVLTTSRVDNSSGRIQSAKSLTARIADELNNNAGLLVSGSSLDIAGNALSVENRSGTLYADERLQLTALLLGGDGKVKSGGDMSLALQQDLHNTGEIAAGGNLDLTTPGQVVNEGIIGAGNMLTLTANGLDNRENGELSATETLLRIAGVVHNTGLIDGGLTHIDAATLENIGTGRIYGDHIALDVNKLVNDKDANSGKAAVIAARERLDIAAGSILNRDHALIYSAGDISIGGVLDNNLNASGQGGTLQNHSAQIEAAGNLSLSMNVIDNRDIHLQLSEDLVEISREAYEEWQWCENDEEGYLCTGGDGKRYVLGPVTENGWRFGLNEDGSTNYDVILQLHENGKYRMRFAVPGFSYSKHFQEFNYEKITSQTQIVSQDAASITSGGDMTINGGTLTNQDSRIVAGGDLVNRGAVLNNLETKGTETIVDVGVRRSYFKKGDWSTYVGEEEYKTGENISRDISLGLLRFEGNTGESGDGYSVNGRDSVSVDGAGNSLIRRDALGAGGSLTWDKAITMPDLLTGGPVKGITDVPLIVPPGQSIALPLAPEEVNGQQTTWEIRLSPPSTRLPDNSLYRTHPGPSAAYLVETDPRFTQEKQWLGTDYMQRQLANNPDNLLKRLGDGYYEQTLIREQIIRGTGQRYLDGQSNDEDQFRMLMDNGLAFAQQYGLTAGVALTAEQMSHLTTSIVWLVTQTVTLPDGSTENVLVPQVYLKVNQSQVSGNGTLIAGNRVLSETTGEVNNSGTIAGREVTRIDAANLSNTGFIQGGAVDITAGMDIRNSGGTILGDNSVSLRAGRDIVSESLTRSQDSNSWISAPATIWVQNPGGSLRLEGVRDVTLTASQTGSAGKDSSTTIIAGNNLTLNTVTTAQQENQYVDALHYSLKSQTQEVGSTVSSGGNLTLAAGNNLSARAADVAAGGVLTASAGNDLTVESGESTLDRESHNKWKTKGFLSKTTHETHNETHERLALGSSFSGDTVALSAGNDLTVRGSTVAGTGDVTLSAGNDLSITTAEEAMHTDSMYAKKKSGLMSSGGLGFTVGKASQKTTQNDDSNVQKGSLVGSSQGNLTLTAGNQLNVHGSELIAGQDMALSGSDVNVTAAENVHTSQIVTEQKSSGFTLALSGTAGSALNSAVTTAREVKHAGSDRESALLGTKAVLSGVQASQAVRLDDTKVPDEKGNLIGLSLTYGSQKSRSQSNLEEHTHQGSTLTAGNNLSVTATGAKGNGDISIQGSALQAGKDVRLDAARDLNLVSSTDTRQTSGSSSGGSVGMSMTAGKGGGLSVSGSVNSSKGKESGNGVTHNETLVTAGNNVTLTSGRDTLLQGAQVSGEFIKADVGRNLTLRSEQDSDRYDMKQTSSSAGVSVPVGGGVAGSASISATRDRMHSNYDSVQEQTGLFAGKGGFDVTVGEHTQLDGAVIASTATADKNRLDTGTLGWSNIENKAEYDVEHQGGGFSTGGSIAGALESNLASTLLVGMNGSGDASSTTQAAVSDGSITIRDKDKQQQDVSTLSRDAEHANQTLSAIFDKEKEQQRIKEAQLIGEIGSQMSDILRTEGKIAGEKAKTDPAALAAARKELDAAGKPYTEEDVRTQAYINAMKPWGTGSTMQQAVQAATAAVQGLAGGNIGQAISGAAAPYLAKVIHDMTTTKDANGKDVVNTEANLMAHAVLGAVVAAAQGNSALAGASGAALGEYIAQQMYPGVPKDKLTEEQKQTISALGTLAAGLVGGIAGDSTADAVAGAQAGKIAVENNALSSTQSLAFDKELSDCRKSGGDCQAVIDKWKQINDKQSAETDQKLKDNPLEAVVVDKESAQGGIDMTERPGWLGNIPGVDVMTSDEAKAYVQQWNGQDLVNIDVNSAAWMSFASYASDPENQAALASLGMLGKDLIAIAKNSLTTKSLFNEMATQGIKFTPENVVSAAKDNSGKIIFLEKGNSKAGLQHIVEEHGSQFAQIGVSEARIPDVVMKAVTDNKIVGYQGSGVGRPIYETIIDGKKYNIAITVGNNGYIVGANLRGSVK
ncbi:filamentous hemagglutinin N-terminal domain-containing protein [Enterobacteriaceae bacterium 4M9]|nr:filamentous hemagglutinin N-terminal domain-containing protein [Enterobacteriaceae bacterium 4M9]